MSESVLTSDEHHADGEYLLGVGVWGDVAEPDAGQRGEREVQGSDVAAADARAAGVVRQVVLVRVLGQRVQPADLLIAAVALRVGYRVPAGRKITICNLNFMSRPAS